MEQTDADNVVSNLKKIIDYTSVGNLKLGPEADRNSVLKWLSDMEVALTKNYRVEFIQYL